MRYVFENNPDLKRIIDEIKTGSEPTYAIYNKAGRRVKYNFETNTATLTIGDNGIEEQNPFYVEVKIEEEPVVEETPAVEEEKVETTEEVVKEELPVEKTDDGVTPYDSEESMESSNEQPSESMEESVESVETTSDSSVECETINEGLVDQPKVEEEAQTVEEDRKEEDESLQPNESIISEVQDIIGSREPDEQLAKEEIPEPVETPVEEDKCKNCDCSSKPICPVEDPEPIEPSVTEDVAPSAEEMAEAAGTEYSEEEPKELTDEDRKEIEEALEVYRALKVLAKYLK